MSECKLVTRACGRLGVDATTADIAVAKWIKVHATAQCGQLFDDTHGIVRFYARTSITSIVGGHKPDNTNKVVSPY